MALTPNDIDALDQLAKNVGKKINWDLRFRVAPNPEYIGVTAAPTDEDDPSHIFIIGPHKLADLGAHDIELDLALLENGERRIVLDEDGDPRLI